LPAAPKILFSVLDLVVMPSRPSIELNVSASEYFRLSDVERFSDGSGFVGLVSLRSGAFCLHEHRFYFDGLDRFLTDVRNLYDSLSGSARLQTPYERDYFAVTAESPGQVNVTGHFELFLPKQNQLDFGFTTDQTFLPALISSLDTAVREIQEN
jgi:hypothetical protein